MELVSAIITTHNREPKILKRAIDSVISQTYSNVEILVIDDSQKDYEYRDEVKMMVAKISDEINNHDIYYFAHEDSLGACEARNTGLRECNGKYIGFLDDDDEWLPHKVEVMMNGFVSDETALVYCDNEIVYDTSGEKKKVVRMKKRGKVYESLIINNYIGSSSFPLIRKSALEEVGGFDKLMLSSQDYDVWLRLSLLYDVNYVEECLARYHIHEGEQITSNPLKKISGSERLIAKNKEYIETHPRVYWSRYMKLVPHYVRAGELEKAKNTWRSCVKKCPLKLKGNFHYLRLIMKKANDICVELRK